MRAVVIPEYGDADVLVVEDVDDPVPGPDEIVVAVRSTALNRADLLQRMGLYPDPSGRTPEIPGLEYAGVVSAVGTRVHAWREGD
ncbi:MAG: alcohol dehydrogenase catalytic domain-containing protein, partial [Actinomycetota bacterium]|nr:alcohol dehydrogenase catalytic domain-containing protein [Actinomycetota bacterium]